MAAVGALPVVTAGAPGVAAASGGLQGNGSIDEAWLTGASPGDSITLLQNGVPVSNPANPGTADNLGSLIIRDLTPGAGYSWDDTSANLQTPAFSVLDVAQSPASTDQPMHQGLNYLTMRDGIQIAATVRYPYGGTCSATAPCPTVVEYSGYGTAGPTDPIPTLLGTPTGDQNLLPQGATYVGAALIRMAGFATVSVQMRGTGCSGGAYDLLGYPSVYDAYDAIEIVAHQSWVANQKVGMVGISYSGLSQLPAAGTDPPDLAAIAPLSPTDDLFSTGYPGGIFNDGFAAGWIGDRIDDAKPAATLSGGQLVPLSATPVAGVAQPWTYYEIQTELAANSGVSTCLQNQALHGQSESLSSLVGPQMVAPGIGPGRDPSLFDRRSMSKWASQINVPVFVSGALQDEQTGPQWPALLSALAHHKHVYANLINGGHIDSTDPQLMTRWLEFLDIYVAGKVPKDPGIFADVFLDEFSSQASGTNAPPLPAWRFTTAKTVQAAKAAYAAGTKRVTVWFDSGAGTVGDGNPQATYQAAFPKWPAPGKATTYFLGSGGTLNATPTLTPGTASLTLDPSARPPTSLPTGHNVWAANPGWNWTTVPAADGLSFQTPAFTADTTFVGPATAVLYLESAAPVQDLQVTVTEVEPGATQEEYVTSGFLRSSNQVLNTDSTKLFTDPTYLASNAVNLSPITFEKVDVPIDPIAHTFRAGTALRIVVSAPGGDRPSWEFATVDNGQQATVGFSKILRSALIVNRVSGVQNTTTLPTCGILRGEPCRAYQAEGNQ